jgi:hypothetical protein
MREASLLCFFSPESFHNPAPGIKTHGQSSFKQGNFLFGNTGQRRQSRTGQNAGNAKFFRLITERFLHRIYQCRGHVSTSYDKNNHAGYHGQQYLPYVALGASTHLFLKILASASVSLVSFQPEVEGRKIKCRQTYQSN